MSGRVVRLADFQNSKEKHSKRKRSTGYVPAESSAVVDSRASLIEAFVGTMSAMGIESFLLQVVLPMRQHMNGLVGHVNQETIRLRMIELRKLDDETLRDTAQRSSPLDWDRRPAFYTALLNVIEERRIGD
jgi:hypothetical protein